MGTEYARETAAFNEALPDPNTANSTADILLDKLSPRLPTSGTLSVLVAGDVTTAVPTVAQIQSELATNQATIIANVGAMDSTLASDVATNKGVMAYIKGLIQELDQRKVSKLVGDARSLGDNSAYTDVVNITDKGVLTGISQTLYVTADDMYGLILVTIDGVDLSGTILTCVYNDTLDNNISASISFNHRFNTSLRVQHKVTAVTDSFLNTMVSYTVDD